MMAARAVGCTTIVAVDVKGERLALAAELGATHTLNPNADCESDEMHDIIKGVSGGGVHYAIDTSGNPKVLRTAFQGLRPLGVCGMIGGAAPGTDVKLDMLELLTQGKTVRGIIQGDAVSRVFIPQLLDLYRQGRFPFDRLITFYENGLEDINAAVAQTKEGGVIKPVLRLLDDPALAQQDAS